ncbi:MAG: hypothetical protein R3B06_25750 [Kofleriaceae bacterium]
MAAPMRLNLCALALVAACAGQLPGGDDDAGDASGRDGGAAVDADGPAPIDPVVHVDLDAPRPVALLPAERLAMVAAALPRVSDPWLKAVLESPDTMFYDAQSIVPGYQDSFGDNVVAPIGMRPNTIDPRLIDTAVPGGHAQLFAQRGRFHFPFGRGIGGRADNLLVDFWAPPRADGHLVPVVWWRRDPNRLTHRYEWMFPVGTVLGEVLFEVADGAWYPYEIRVRVRELGQWRVDVYRPFPTAADLADAVERKRDTSPAWQAAADVTALIAAARDPGTLAPATLGGSHYAGAFAAIAGARDVLPGLADPSLLGELLRETPFRSARGAAWKRRGPLVAYAATTAASFHIVPNDYDGGFLEVSEASCARCHADAGRPFRDYYANVLAYGELWGMDEVFTWHPFATAAFVDAAGDVVDFNYDNRQLRGDLVTAGLLAPFTPSTHTAPRYGRLPSAWRDFAY